MKRDWMTVGKEVTEGNEAHWADLFGRVEWHHLPCTLAAMPGMAIKGMVKTCNIKRPVAVGDSYEAAPFGLVAVEANYENGTVRAYALDRGSDCLVLCVDFWPTGETPPALVFVEESPVTADTILI